MTAWHSFRPPAEPRRGSVFTQRFAREAARRAELDQIRIERPLTREEQAEHDLLTNRLYMREYRKAQAQRWGRA